MKYTWLQLHDLYIVRREDNPKPVVSKAGIRRLIQTDDDYLLMLTCPRGEIYRYSDDGSIWCVYLKPTKGGHKRKALWKSLDKMGFEKQTEGDFEAAWKFPAEKLKDVAKLMKMRPRRKRVRRTENETV